LLSIRIFSPAYHTVYACRESKHKTDHEEYRACLQRAVKKITAYAADARAGDKLARRLHPLPHTCAAIAGNRIVLIHPGVAFRFVYLPLKRLRRREWLIGFWHKFPSGDAQCMDVAAACQAQLKVIFYVLAPAWCR
jgi:hypothetical protein